MLFSIFNSDQSWSGKILTLILISVAMIIALPFHELAHAYVAYKMGDTSQKSNGRMTLNPMKHLDLMGTICILLTGFGWAKPVYVNTSLFNRGGKYAYLWVSAAGPLSNLLMGFVCAFLFVLSDNMVLGMQNTAAQTGVLFIIFGVLRLVFQYILIISINLAVLNLIPVPPFDGYGIVSAFFSEKANQFIRHYQQYIGLIFLILLVTGLLSGPLGAVSSVIYNGFVSLAEHIL